MIRLASALTLALLAGVLTVPVSAQTASPDPQVAAAVETASAAYREGRYADAVSVLAPLVDGSDNAEAHYFLGRVLYDEANPDRDVRRAEREIGKAVDLDPTNVVYLVAQLEGLRRDSWNFVQELLLFRQRFQLARRILALDPENAHAHEELGEAAIRDYYQYRNAITLTAFQFRSPTPEYAEYQDQSRFETSATDEGPVFDLPDPSVKPIGLDETMRAMEDAFGDQNEAFLGVTSNRFDLDRMASQGIQAVSLRDRADRAYAVAIEHLRQALETDPRRRSVYDHLVRLAALAGTWADAVPVVQEMDVQFPNDPATFLYEGLVYHRVGAYDAADAAFRVALSKMDPETRAAYTDLTMILPPEDWAAFQADPEAFAQRYWTSRDPRFLNRANERQTEHFARLVTADLLYRSVDLDLPGWKTERGRLFVRYGVPRKDVIIEGDFALVLEAFPDRDPSFTPPEMAQISNRFNVWDYGDMMFVFEDPNRNGEFRLYSPPADVYGLQSARGADRMDFERRAKEAVRRTPERYTFEAPGRQVELPYLVTEFKGEGGQTDLYVNYGIPISEAAPQAEGSVQPDVDLTVRTGAFLIGPQRDLLVERRRTLYGLRGAQIVPFNLTRLWTGVEAMEAQPGKHEVSLEFETASGATNGVQRRAVDVRDFSGEQLQLSDILLAYLVTESDGPEPGRIERNDLSIQPAPWSVFGVGDPVYLYFETYGLGLAGGRTDYEVEARLVPKDTSTGLRRLSRRIFGRRAQGVSSAFEVQGDRADDGQYVILDAADQAPGLYTLTVTVRDRVSGREAHQETDLLLEEQ